jgi:hypothetical protein
MATATRIEALAGRRLSPQEIVEITQAREKSLSRLLVLYIVTGLGFMLLPGTFLGVWNLLAISSHRTANSVSAGWVQAHGHAQIFGWIGTFILGIGFYSIPKLRRMDPFGLWTACACWGLWTVGVGLRWTTGVYQWHWRVWLPLSAAFELAAFLIFLYSVSGHRSQGPPSERWEAWVLVVISASVGLLATLLVNFETTLLLAIRGASPDLPHAFDQRFLVLETWGFLVPFVWGFSARWLPVFLGLQLLRGRVLLVALALNSAGVIAAMGDWTRIAVILLATGIVVAILSIRLFEPTKQPAKVKGVHSSFPIFVRMAYVWALIAATLATWAAFGAGSYGIWGASRHALTVGFLSTMVFCVGQRVLPAFSGMRLLLSTKLMFVSLLLLNIGCTLRVTSEILAYQGLADWAWSWLSVSAITEMIAVMLFAINLSLTFVRRPTLAIANAVAIGPSAIRA